MACELFMVNWGHVTEGGRPNTVQPPWNPGSLPLALNKRTGRRIID